MKIKTPAVKRVDIVRARPEAGDTRSIESIEKRENVSLDRAAWMVVLSLDYVPEPGGQMLSLHLDDYWVRKYWAFDGGIYFKVYNPRFFVKHGGKTFRFVAEDGTVIRTGEYLPKAPREAERVTTEAMAESRVAGGEAELPSQQSVLSRIARR